MTLDRNKSTTHLALLLLRVMVGVVFIYHGGSAIFSSGAMTGFATDLRAMEIPVPTVAAWMAKGSELICGVLLVVGLFVHIAVIPLIGIMVVAILTVHGHAFSIGNKPVPGMEYNLVLISAMVAIGILGPGRYGIKPPRD